MMAKDKAVDDAIGAAQSAAYQQMQWQAMLKKNGRGAILPTLFNALLVFDNDIAWRDVIAFDEFSYRVVKRKTPPTRVVKIGEWSDLDDVQALVYIAEEHGFEPRKAVIMDAVLSVAHQNAFHPVREWLRSLEFDGQARVQNLAGDYFGGISTAETASLGMAEKVELGIYLKLLSVKWLVGAVARIMNPGCKLDTMPVLEGSQGSFKSTALRLLFGSEWFSDSKLVIGDKDALANMQGKWCNEMAEMDSHRKADDTAFKQFLSTQTDRVRWHYGRRAEDVPRQSVFVGTTNMAQYGKDETGLRRIWPFAVGSIDLAAIKRDREQLWAEAVKLFDAGVSWWVDGNKRVIDPETNPAYADLFDAPITERDLFSRQAEDRMQVDAWLYPIVDWLEQNNGAPHITTAEVLGGALNIDRARWSKSEQMRVSAILKRLGYEHRKVGPRTARVWAFVKNETASVVPGASKASSESDNDLPI
jgi:putative DNA primase/helicase